MNAATDTTTAYRRHVATGAPMGCSFPATTGSWAHAFATTGMRAGIQEVTSTLKPTNEPVNDQPTRRGAPPH